MIHLLGIRHHGPGSARSVLAALRRIQPDCILIEGPSDADALIAHVAHAELVPPVALLINTPIQKQEKPQAAFYPFAEFSPEWQAMRFAVAQQVPVSFMDLPCLHAFAIETAWQEKAAADSTVADEQLLADIAEDAAVAQPEQACHQQAGNGRLMDPIQLLAEQAGYQDGERFWEHLVEQQPHAGDVFPLIADAMQGVRSYIEDQYDEAYRQSFEYYREQLREASMRKVLRQMEKAGYQNIAVICGAWHVPALTDLKASLKADTALLKGLPKLKTEAAWVAWTHGRLNRMSGYGAGIEAAGWYAHLWKHYAATPEGQAIDGQKISIDWLSRFARLLREQGQDASSAQLIDAVQLIQALLSLRGRHVPDLDDLQEAIVSVLHHGYELPQPVLAQLLVDERLGQVPDSLQTLPIQQDFLQHCKSFRLKLEAPHREIELDLRVAFDLAKSQFLHRLKLLGLQWAQLDTRQKGRGSYRETWTLSWQPENALYLNEMSVWGNSIYAATQAYLYERQQQTTQVAELAETIEQILLSALDDSLHSALQKLDELSSQQHDPIVLINALSPLANALRYGSVRAFDPELLQQIIRRFALRICLALPLQCQNLNDDVAQERVKQLSRFYQLIDLLDTEDFRLEWQKLLLKLLDMQGLHGYVQGWCCRLAHEQHVLDDAGARTRFAHALSLGQLPEHSAAWFEGFMTGQALLLLHDDSLWQLVDGWLMQLPAQQFTELLPLLRRTTASFSGPERQQLAQKSGPDGEGAVTAPALQEVDEVRGNHMLQALQHWMGLALNGQQPAVLTVEEQPG